MIRSIFLQAAALMVTSFCYAQSYNLPAQNDRWKIQPDGSIEWMIDKRLPHNDHIEMGGEKVALWVQYEVDTSGKAFSNAPWYFPHIVCCRKEPLPT